MKNRITPPVMHVTETLSTIPSRNFTGSDLEILRAAILWELDAINLYTQMAEITKNSKVKSTLLDIAREEKTHVGELQALLIELDPEYKQELENGKKEIEWKED